MTGPTSTYAAPDPPTLIPAQVLEKLQLKDLQTLHRKLASGAIPGGFKVGPNWRVNRAVFEAWLIGSAR